MRERDRGYSRRLSLLIERGIQRGGDNDGLEPGGGVRPGLLGWESNGVEVGVGAGVGSGSRADSVLVWEGVGDGEEEEEGERDLGGILECTCVQGHA